MARHRVLPGVALPLMERQLVQVKFLAICCLGCRLHLPVSSLTDPPNNLLRSAVPCAHRANGFDIALHRSYSCHIEEAQLPVCHFVFRRNFGSV